jgi:hypothetical protein
MSCCRVECQEESEHIGERRAIRQHFHGINCPKVIHEGDGFLHSPDDDSPYSVDGVSYCGRCHMAL